MTGHVAGKTGKRDIQYVGMAVRSCTRPMVPGDRVRHVAREALSDADGQRGSRLAQAVGSKCAVKCRRNSGSLVMR